MPDKDERITDPKELRDAVRRVTITVATMGVRVGSQSSFMAQIFTPVGAHAAIDAALRATADRQDQQLGEIKARLIGPLVELIDFLEIEILGERKRDEPAPIEVGDS